MTTPVGYIPDNKWPKDCLDIKEQDPEKVRKRLTSSLESIKQGKLNIPEEDRKAHQAAIEALLVDSSEN